MATRREEITNYLKGSERTVRELAGLMRMRVKDTLDDLEHIRKSHKKAFKVRPALCPSCGYVFETRGKLSSPGRCPQCRGERVVGPWLSIETDD